MEPETVTCSICGAVNDAGRALCIDCNRPLTAYAEQLDSQQHINREEIQRKIASLDTRPPAVLAMTLFYVVFAVFWPLAYVVGAFMSREKVNAEGTNYLSAAFDAIGPFLSAGLLVPFALLLVFLAWATWTQRSWAWTAGLVTLGLFALKALQKGVGGAVWLVVAAVLAFFWFREETKVWYGHS